MTNHFKLKRYDPSQKTLGKNLGDFVQGRQNYHCGDCGLPFGINRQAQIYHLDLDNENNKANNLIALCSKCYRQKIS